MHTLQQLVDAGRIRDKRVFIRSDLNVPQDTNGAITDDTRIRASVQAICLALDAGAGVMVASHLGRPTPGVFEPQYSLEPVAQRLSTLLGRPVPLVRDWLDGVEVACGQVVLLENCRFHVGEKENDPALAQQMASLCDVYVNDAFATAHRAEATTEGIGQYAPVACAGPLLDAEISAIGAALQAPKHPLIAIVGGSKVSTKLTILERLSHKVDYLIVGGGIANTFLRAAGYAIGKSLYEEALLPEAKALMQQLEQRGAALPLPSDVVVTTHIAPDAPARTVAVDQVGPDEMIVDIGPRSSASLAEHIAKAGTIVWNGPVGIFEIPQFAQGTQSLAQAIAASPAYSLAGGGDTVAAISVFGVTDAIDYISTGGGAFLEILEGKTLPALAMLQSKST